nr:DUF4149 domain-containing protein [Neisseria meningitidis]
MARYADYGGLYRRAGAVQNAAQNAGGRNAGGFFDILSWSGLAVWGAVLAAAFAALTRRQTALLLFLLSALAANQFLVTPVIEALKYGHENWLLSFVGGSFGMWHGISSIVFMAAALLSIYLSWRLSGKDAV